MNQQQSMNLSLKIEEVAITSFLIYLLSQYSLGLSVWIWVLLFFSPDLSMLGYLVNTRLGAITYNLFHHRGVALAVAAVGFFIKADVMISAGLLLAAHSSFDRVMGYGLKFSDDFKHTHLGWIGNNRKDQAAGKLI